ncbi:MAG: PKD domain-containing protein, partial [Bacteroidota bacterium]
MKIFTKFLYVNLLSYCFLLPFLASGQTANLRFSPSLDCQNGQYAATMQIQAANTTVFRLGTSSILVNFNAAALQFASYSSLRFDGSDLCVVGAAPAWDEHAFDGTSVAGTFNLTMVLNSEPFSCPDVTDAGWVDIGTILFNVLDSTASPDLGFDVDNTNFNVDQPNDGTVTVGQGTYEGISGNVLVCSSNTSPTASFTATPTSGAAPLTVAFDGSASTDPDGTITRYAWIFGDGTVDTSLTATATPSHTYATAGTYLAQLIVTDDSAAKDTADVQIVVNASNIRPTANVTANPTTGTFPLAVSFDGTGSTDSDGTITRYAWIFGDGTVDTSLTASATPTHTYTVAGTYQAQLIVTDDSTGKDTADVQIVVNATNIRPTASVTANPTTGTAPLAVTFDGTGSTDSDGTITRYAWIFGDGTVDTSLTASATPTHTYTVAGTYQAQLIVTDDSTAKDTADIQITVNAQNLPPKPTFSATPLTGAAPLDVAFDAALSNDPDGTIASYLWKFGDDSTGTGVTINHIYANEGTYTAVLVVTDDQGLSDSATVDITVSTSNRPPTARFSVDTLAGESPLTIFFDATASADTGGTINSYEWIFGDGGTGNGDTISYTYVAGGIFFPRLVVTDNDGATDTVSKVIFVQNPGDTAATQLRFVDSLDCPGDTFYATVQMQSSNARFFKIGTSSILFSYNNQALQFDEYESLNFDGSDLCVANAAPAWDAHSFDATSVAGVFNLTLVLNSEQFSCPEIRGDEWVDIGRVKFIVLDSTASPNLVFDAINTNFNVDQPNDGTVVIGKGNFESLTGNVLACPDNARPTAAFTATPNTGTAPLLVAFDANTSTDSDGVIVSYTWDFGDGVTGNGVTATHTYTAGGTFLAQLIVLDDNGGRDTASISIVVTPGENQEPTANFTATPDSGFAPLTVSFDASSSVDPDGIIVSYTWDFGDDSTGVGATISHIFDTVGVFNVRLIVVDDSAAADTFFLPINVITNPGAGGPVAAIVLSDSIGSSPYAIGFDATSSVDSSGTIVSYEWDYGDGVQDTGRTAVHTYLVPGNYEVTLIVTNDQGTSDTVTTSVVINPGNIGPTAAFTVTPDSGAVPLVVNFDASTSSDPEGTIVSYEWDFGNGNIGTGQTVTDTFIDAGIYTVNLYVRDEAGAMDTTSLQVTVAPPVDTIPVANLRFVDSLDCASDTFVATIQIRAANTDTFRLGTSSILFNYNDTALTFVDYRSLTFNGSDLCVANAAPAWDDHAFDGLSVPGAFNMTMVLNSEQFSCPDVVGTEWISIGQVIFTINDRSLNPSLVFDTTSTNFNIDQPNDGSVVVGKGRLDSLSGDGLLICPQNLSPVAAFTPSPDTGLVPLAVSFDASASFDPDGQILTYTWDFGDGNTGTGRTAIHTYTAAGEFNARLIVEDDSAATDTLIIPIIIRGGNALPVANFIYTPDGTNAPIGVTFDASTSTDLDGTIVGYFWDFGNGVLDTGAVVIDTFTSAGIYTVTLTVVDDFGGIDTATQQITILPPIGTEPFADLRFADTLNCSNGTFTATLQLRASNTFNYNIGTSSILFTYNDTALQFVNYESLTFDGSDLCVANAAPAWDAHAIDAVTIPGTFNLTLVLNSEQFSCPEINGLDWVNIGRVTFNVLDSTLSPQMVFDTTNTNFNVNQPNDGSVVVGKGNFAALDGPVLICPDNEAPNASFIATPISGNAPLDVSFDASASTDSDGTIVSYEWDFGDGATGLGVTATHTYLAGGVFTAQLTVTDEFGAVDSIAATITVLGNNLQPTASFTSAPDSINAPIEIGFDATTSVDPDGTILSYLWDFGDGNTGTGVTTTHTYTSAGFYNAQLIVIDDGGLSDTVTNVVKVLPPIGTEPIADLRFVDSLDCNNNTFSAFLQIRAANTQNFQIGTSSVLFTYNDTAIQFSNYESYTFDGSDLCVANAAPAWDVHAFDATTVPGTFNLTLVLNSEQFSCPEINGLDWVTIGRIDFAVLDSSLDVSMAFDSVNTNFNVDQPNDGSVVIGKGNFASLSGVNLSCSTPDGPNAVFTPTPATGPQPLSVSFDASASSDNSGNILSYDWDFGDGNTGIGILANNVYANEGVYTATLVITNDLGQRDTATALITVQAPPGTDPSARMRLVDSLDCDNKILITTIQIQSSDLQNFKLGTSSVFLTYNDTALQFNSYNSLAFDGSDLCINGVAPAWDEQSFDGTSVSGSFNLTMVLNSEGFGCPEITGTDWVSIGEVRFDILNSTLNPRIAFDSSATNFNVDLPNDGTVVVQKDTLIGLDSVGILICPGNLPPTASFVADPIAGAPPLTVNFDGTSSIDADGTILSYVWDFDDGTGIPLTGAVVSRVFNAEDTFSVSLIVTDDGGLSDTTTIDIVVSAENIRPLANFTVDPLNGNAPLAVTLDGSSSVDADGTIVSYQWDFGDNTPGATGILANHTYTVPGLQVVNYTATLIVTDDEGARDTATIVIPVGPPNDPPIASFVFNPNTGEAPIAINFNASASTDPDPGGSIVSYEWDFGDGGNGDGVTATHTYTQGGTFTVRLVVTDDRGEIGTLSRQIVIQAGNINPVARYTATPITGEAPLTVNFNGTTSTDADGNIVTYAWDFGDNTNGTGATTTHTYNAPGVYISSLTVTDDEGGTGVASVIITVNEANLRPSAAFTATPPVGTAPLTVSFNSGASVDPDGTIQTYAWNFGDGTTANGANPTHTYTAVGTYEARLIITDNDGALDTAIANIIVNPPLNITPVAQFVATPIIGAPPLAVSFDANTSNDPDGVIQTYAWDFGDGNTGMGVTATHTYAAVGTYTAQLTVTDDSAATNTFAVTITVRAANVAPVASFTATPTIGDAPLLVAFDASASNDPDGTIQNYAWDFGDGTTSLGITANHTYTVAGTYTAQLTVTDDSLATNTFAVTITVNGVNVAPVASFTATPTVGNAPLAVAFDASASNDPDGVIQTYAWDFGDGTVGMGVTATHTYTIAGTYTAQLTVTDDSLATNTFAVIITVNAVNVAPVASFTATPTVGNAPLAVAFDASASNDPDGNIVTYAWDFGDGTTGMGVTATHTYTVAGTYTAQLTVT